MSASSTYRIETDEIRASISRVLERYFEFPRVIRRVTRRRSAYSSSYALENLHVELDGGQTVRLVLKDTSPLSVLAYQHHVRPDLVYCPEREIEVYETILDPRLGTPICFGSTAEGSKRYWLFLERVVGRPLWQFGRLQPWCEAAVWLASLHSQLSSEKYPLGISSSKYLVRYDDRFFATWLARADAFLSDKFAVVPKTVRRRFYRLIDRFHHVLAHLSRLPKAFIHGEFFAANVLVRRRVNQASPGVSTSSWCAGPLNSHICPIDWEMAGIGPGLLDLAALTAGKWSADAKQAMIRAYYHGLSSDHLWPGPLEDMVEAVDYCQLQLCLQWLGWSSSWAPPEQHAFDWLDEALRLANKLGLSRVAHSSCRSNSGLGRSWSSAPPLAAVHR
jgi:thiamine kinase-like enzyme